MTPEALKMMDYEEKSLLNEYGFILLGLAAALGVLSVRARYQQKLQERREGGGEVVVTADFKSFQGSFMSKFLIPLFHTPVPISFLIACTHNFHVCFSRLYIQIGL